MPLVLLLCDHFLKSFGKLEDSVKRRVLKDIHDSNLIEEPKIGKLLRNIEVKVNVNGSEESYKVREIRVGPRRKYRLFYAFDRKRGEIYLVSVRLRKNAFKRSLPERLRVSRESSYVHLVQ